VAALPCIDSGLLYVPVGPQRDSQPAAQPALVAAALSDVGSVGRLMQCSTQHIVAAAAAPAAADAVAAEAPAPPAASTAASLSPVPLAPFDLDAPVGSGGTHVEGSTCLAVAPAHARPLWRLAAVLSQPQYGSHVGAMPVPVRVRLFVELVAAVASGRSLASHLEELSEAQARARAKHRRLLEQTPAETRASALARHGAPMELVAAVKAEEARRYHSRVLPGGAWLATRPPRHIRAMALSTPHLPPPADAVARLVRGWAVTTLADAAREAASAAVLSAGSGSGGLGAAVAASLAELLPHLPSFFLRAHFVTAYSSRTLGSVAVGASVPRSRLLADTAATAASVDGADAGPARKGAKAALPPCPIARMAAGPWPELGQAAGRELAALAATLPMPVDPRGADGSGKRGMRRGGDFMGVSASDAKAAAASAGGGAADAGGAASAGSGEGGSRWTVRLKLQGATRSLGSGFTHELIAARAYDLAAWAVRGPAAFRLLNFPGDVALLEATVQAWASKKDPLELTAAAPAAAAVALPSGAPSAGTDEPLAAAAAVTTDGAMAVDTTGIGDGVADTSSRRSSASTTPERPVSAASPAAPVPTTKRPRRSSLTDASASAAAADVPLTGPANDWGVGDSGGSASAAAAPLPTAFDASPSDLSLWLAGGSEHTPDDGEGDDEPGCDLSGLEELRWQKRAAAGYPARWSHDETLMLVRALLKALEAQPEACSASGDIAPSLWQSILLAYPFSSQRTASDLRDQYDVLRCEHDGGKWSEVVKEAVDSAAKATESSSASGADTQISASLATGDQPAQPAAAGTGTSGTGTGSSSSSSSSTSTPPASAASAASLQRLATSLPWRPLTPADRAAPSCRELEKSRAFLEWEAEILAAEVAITGLGPRALPLGCDRAGRSYFVLGAFPGEVWVQGPSFATGLSLTSQPTSDWLQSLPDAPAQWGVIDSPERLRGLIGTLSPIGAVEGPLREALQRRVAYLEAAMHAHAAAPALAPPAGASSLPPEGACRRCGTCSAPALSREQPPAVHCFVCHGSIALAADASHGVASLAQAAARAHVRACWAAHCSTTGASRARVLASTAGGALASSSQGAALLRLKRQLASLAEAVDWSRLRNACVWPPHARAAWLVQLLAAPTLAGVLRCFVQLEAALAADDAAAAVAARVRDAERRAADAGAAAGAAPPPPPPWQWLRREYLEQHAGAPLPVDASSVTLSALALRVRALADALGAGLLVAL
jgi:hypothetical protein